MYKFAIVGAGKQAEKHLKALSSADDLAIVVADIDSRAARSLAEAHGSEATTEVEAVLADSTIDAALLCTPTHTHLQLAGTALASGKHVFCEKPLAETIRDAEYLNELARTMQRHGVVGYVYRFVPAIFSAKKLLSGADKEGQSPVLGRITAAHFRLGGRGSHRIWKHRQETAGGAINEMLTHMVDLAVWFFGPARFAQLLMRDLRQPQRHIDGTEYAVDAEDYVLTRIVSDSGVECLLQADLLTPSFSHFIEIQGTNGSLIASIQPEIPSRLFLVKAAGEYPAGYTDLSPLSESPFATQMAEFADLVRLPERTPRSPFADSVKTLAVLERIRSQEPKL